MLIAYHNLGMVTAKRMDVDYAVKVFKQGLKMSKKFFGPDSNFSKRFKRKISKYEESPDLKSRVGMTTTSQSFSRSVIK